ncbi:ethanolamine kinase 1 isoform X1 [Ictalurus furcatus]|uniref:ethanolamine kinase 1 isoform X1 n=1 Tax=Ictalurus furcatus TaxID=66913 RepID=UPI002350E0A6|nr:ethanolamine kinase 1 isoform X1 [Ictalurus furcatus]
MNLLLNDQTDEPLHLDLCLDELSPETGIIELLKTLRPQWRAEDIQLKMFTEGITNQLLCCSVSSDTAMVLVRVYGRKTELFLDRKKEVEMLKLLHSHGCGPRLYCSFHNGICYEFLKGVALEDVLLQQPSVYRTLAFFVPPCPPLQQRRSSMPSLSPGSTTAVFFTDSQCRVAARLVAVEMGKIHSIKPKSSWSTEPVLWSKLDNYLKLLQDCENDDDVVQQDSQLDIPSVDVLISETEELKKHLKRVESPTVLCHNDLLTKNIIYNSDEGGVKFIDYEYADFNYQAYDIGNHFNEFAGVNNVDYGLYPSRELQWDWLTVYLQSIKINSQVDSQVTQREVNTLYVQVCKFSLASHLSWGLWALLQARYSTINFNFLKYAAARFSYYFKKKEEYLGMALP